MTSEVFKYRDEDYPAQNVMVLDEVRIAPLRAMDAAGVHDMVMVEFGKMHDDHVDTVEPILLTRKLTEDLIVILQEGLRGLDAGEFDENTGVGVGDMDIDL